MSISLRVTEEEMAVIKSYADLHGTTVSDAVRGAILEKIEDEFDIKIFDEAMQKRSKGQKAKVISLLDIGHRSKIYK